MKINTLSLAIIFLFCFPSTASQNDNSCPLYKYLQAEKTFIASEIAKASEHSNIDVPGELEQLIEVAYASEYYAKKCLPQ